MRLHHQKRWKKTYLVTIGFAIYSVLTAFSYSADNWEFPTGAVFKETGKIVWESEVVGKTERPNYTGWAENVIHGKALSTVPNSNWGVVDGYHGIVLAPGIILTFSGMSYAASSRYNVRVDYQYQGEPKASSTQNGVEVSKNDGIYKYKARLANIQYYSNDLPHLYQASQLKVALYISNSVKPGTYSYSGLVNLEVGEMRVYLNKTLKFDYTPPILCTINTPPKIDFGKVNIWEWEGNTSGTPGGNRKDVLGSIDGNFTINCTGSADAHTPAKLTLKGTVQTYSNDLKMTMDATGEVAPATIRASIKSIYAPCHTSGINFGTGGKTPPANEVNLGELTVGQHLIPYRFSLCALGEGFKSGAASASATVTIDWE